MLNLELYIFTQILMIIPVTYMFYRVWMLSAELHDSNMRLITLSSALQKVEYTTGKPWFTSTGIPNKVEASEWLNTHYKDKLNIVTERAIARRHRRRY